MTKLELMQKLLADVLAMSYEDEDSDLMRQTELYIKKCFGDKSAYLQKLAYVSFIPPVVTPDMPDSVYRQSFEIGKKQLIGLIKTMIEDLNLSIDSKINPKEQDKRYKGQVFIVHGHDTVIRTEVEAFILRIGYEPIILCKEADGGDTIIEKIERYSKDISYAIVIYTGCDMGRDKDNATENPRARQNVVFEHGYLCSKIGRDKVRALVVKGVELPGDYSGVVFEEYKPNGGWKLKMAQEMQTAGLQINLEDIK